MKELIKKLLGSNYNEQAAIYVSINFFIILLMIVVSAVMLAFGLLPDKIPMQWSLTGKVNHYLPSTIGVWIPALVALVVNLTSISRGNFSLITTLITGLLCVLMIVLYLFIL